MVVTGPQDLIHQIAVVSEENQPLRVFIQTANREDAAAVVDEIHDVVALAIFRGTDNANRFIQRDKYQVFFVPWLDQLTIHFDHIARNDLIANGGAFTVDKHVALFDVTVSLAARADPALANVFV